MRIKLFKYLLVSAVILTLSISLASCNGDDNISPENIQGHWLYKQTVAEVTVADPSLRKIVEEYVVNRNKVYHVSYEFKNDGTYYYYINYRAPIKGVYLMLNDNYAKIEDSQGVKNVVSDNDEIYVTSDIRQEIVKELKISEDKLIKVNATDVFERGLLKK